MTAVGGRTRQGRLPGTNLPGEANLRVVRKPLLSASTLASWLYCRTKPFVARILERLGIDTSTPAMRRGAEAHAEVQGALSEAAPETTLTFPEALARKAFLFADEVHLLDERRRLHGYVDLLFAHEGRLHVVELKNTRGPQRADPLWQAPVWAEHGMQLHLYGLVARSVYGVPPRLFLTYLQGGSKERMLDQLETSKDPQAALLGLRDASVSVTHGPREARIVLDEVARFRRAERALEVPTPNHANPRKCGTCSVRQWCPRRLDQPGQYAPLDPALLDDAGGTDVLTN